MKTVGIGLARFIPEEDIDMDSFASAKRQQDRGLSGISGKGQAV
jgi:hypothetical protein